MQISVLADVKPLLGEGPLWDAEGERLYFVDALGRRVFRCTAEGGEMRAWLLPSRVGSMALWTSDASVVALADGFHRLDLGTGEVDILAGTEPDHPGIALNDGKVDPRGRFLCGSMDLGEEEPTGALWRLDPDLSLTRLEEGIICSNGPCWSPDGWTFYFADSFRGRIWAYDYDPETGAVANRRDFVVIDPDRGGAPDGATVDAEGFLWSAAVFDGRIRRFSPEGVVERTIEMPSAKSRASALGALGSTASTSPRWPSRLYRNTRATGRSGGVFSSSMDSA